MKSFGFTLLTFLLAGTLVGLLVWAMGENPFYVYKILFVSSFGSANAISYTLFYATPLIFTGLSVALAFHAGLFNIGAEGQLYVGAFAATLVGLAAPAAGAISLPWLIAAVLAAFVGGGIWGAIPGILKAYRGSHEVIVTIMLNAIAMALLSYFTLYHFRDPESQGIETSKISGAVEMPSLSRFLPLPENGPANLTFFFALAVALAVGLFLYRTRFGFSLRAVGQNESAARCAGISTKAVIVGAMFLAGGLAGLVGVNEILGYAHRFRDGFSPGYGFFGIAVALVGRNHPLGIVLSALFFGALQNGSIALDLDTDHLSRDLITVLQGVIILAVASEAMLRSWVSRLKRGKG